MKKTNRKSGFTLVELMIVAAIIAILAAIIIPLLASNRERAIVAEGQNILGTAATACKAYYAEFGQWPTYTQLPLLTRQELERAKYFGTISWGAGQTLAAWTISTTANTAANNKGVTGDLSLNQNSLWGGTLAATYNLNN